MTLLPSPMIQTRELDVPAADGLAPARLSLHAIGKGPLAFLLHGYPLDHRMWLAVMQSPLRERRTLVALDLRGHGGSPWAGDPVHRITALADDVAAAIKSLSDEPVDVAGLSMGGYVALALVARHPERVRSLVLSNTRAGADDEAQRAGRAQAIETVVARGRAAIADGMLPKLLAPDADVLVRAQVRTMIETQPVETIVADLRGLAERADRRGELGAIQVPTLVVAGELDQITPAADADLLARGIPNAQRATIAAAGHLAPLEQPAAWADAVGSFWN